MLLLGVKTYEVGLWKNLLGRTWLGRFLFLNGVYQRGYISGMKFNAVDTVGVFCLSSSRAITFFELRGFLNDNHGPTVT